jgi:hypothetical protein
MLASQLVPPAVGDPLSKPDTRELTAQLGLEAAAGLAGAGGHCTLELAQLGPHVCIERAGDGGGELQVMAPRRAGMEIATCPALSADPRTTSGVAQGRRDGASRPSGRALAGRQH